MFGDSSYVFNAGFLQTYLGHYSIMNDFINKSIALLF